MGVKEVVYDFLFKLDISSAGIFDDWYLAIILLILFTLTFGHTLEKSLEGRHFISYLFGFIFAIFPVIVIFFLFHFVELYTGLSSTYFYQFTNLIFVVIALSRLFKHHKEKRKLR